MSITISLITATYNSGATIRGHAEVCPIANIQKCRLLGCGWWVKGQYHGHSA